MWILIVSTVLFPEVAFCSVLFCFCLFGFGTGGGALKTLDANKLQCRKTQPLLWSRPSQRAVRSEFMFKDSPK